MTTDIVIPACDEAHTIGDVVAACRRAPSAGIVTVAVNGTDNGTSEAAGNAGAYITFNVAADKGSAMRQGLNIVQTENVLFCDGDLVGLRWAHVEAMLTWPPADGQLAGLTDNPLSGFTRWLPPITGQRRLPTEFARRLPLLGSGYEAELRIDAAVGKARLPHSTILLRGVSNPTRAAVNPWRFAQMVASVTVATGYLFPELVAYEVRAEGRGQKS